MMQWDSFIDTFKTGSGFWNPLVWITVIIIALLIVYIIRSFGKKGFKEGTEQTKPFLSGNPEVDKDKMHVKGSNLYWGFMESLRWSYDILKKIHTGNVSDYVLWFVVVMGILFIFIVGVF